MNANQTKEEFANYAKTVATGGRTTKEYKELYMFLLDCFKSADRDLDGKINAKEFDDLIEVAAAAPRKFGYAPTWQSMYKTAEGRYHGRMQMFSVMDCNRDGTISWDEWLNYCYNHICEMAKTLK